MPIKHLHLLSNQNLVWRDLPLHPDLCLPRSSPLMNEMADFIQLVRPELRSQTCFFSLPHWSLPVSPLSVMTMNPTFIISSHPCLLFGSARAGHRQLLTWTQLWSQNWPLCPFSCALIDLFHTSHMALQKAKLLQFPCLQPLGFL